MLRAARAGVGAVVAAAVALAACGEPASEDDVETSQSGVNVRFRLWDETAASAYQESFDAFNAIHRDIQVEVEVVPPDSYASRAVSDLATGTMADVFWVSSDAVEEWADLTDLLDPRGALDASADWEPAVTDLFAQGGRMWAVPQLWETSALFVNDDLVDAAAVEAASLVWDPAATAPGALADPVEPGGEDSGPTDAEADADAHAVADGSEPSAPADGADLTEASGTGDPGDDAPDTSDTADAAPEDEPADAPADSLRAAVRTLTRDAEGRSATDPDFDAGAVTAHGFNPDRAAVAVWLPFLAQYDGATSGDEMLVATRDAAAVFTYLLELPAAPPPEGTTDLELFTKGHLALFMATSADLRAVAEHATVDWSLAQVPAGPAGQLSVVSGIGAAANAHTPSPEATAEVLRWLASTDGQSALASQSVGIPAALGAQELFDRTWADRDVDTARIRTADVVVTIATGSRTADAVRAIRPILTRMFDGELAVAEALTAAQRAAADARESG